MAAYIVLTAAGQNVDNIYISIMKYYNGRNNLACTIFVPFKCGNNCAFCNSKVMYDNYIFSDEYLNKILENIQLINDVDFVKEFVLTGGEPFFNLDIMKCLIDTMDKGVYINTTFPNVKNIDEIIEYINNEPKILGVNISRHIGIEYPVNVCGIEKINMLNNDKSVRINSILTKEHLKNEQSIKDFISYWATPYRLINFRADYRTITTDTLKNVDDIDLWLFNNYQYEFSNNCMVCNSEFFTNDIDVAICYHRGLEHSSVTYGDRCYINDIIINIYGNIFKDWDMIPDNEFIDFIKNSNNILCKH